MLVESFCNDMNPRFPDEFYDCLPKRCPVCGFPTEMSEALTSLRCSNVRCPSKIAQRLVAMANQLGIKNLGDSRAESIVLGSGIRSPLDLFAYEPDTDGVLCEEVSMDLCQNLYRGLQEKKKFTLAEYVRYANIPNIQMSAFELFGRFDDLGEAYSKIETGGVEYVRDCLNIKSKGTEDVSIRAVKVYESLMTFKSDLETALPYVEILRVNSGGMKTLKVVCSTEIGGEFRTKADFYATCNNMYPDIHIEFGSAVTKKTDFLVWKGANGSPAAVTNKVKKARGYGIKIVTPLDFISYLGTISSDVREG